LKRANRINPKRAEYLMVLGNVYSEMGESTRAVDAYDRALAMKPKLPKAHFRLAQILVDSEPARSVHHFRAAIDLAPNSPVALTQLAWILASHPDAALRDGAQALAFAESAVRMTEQEDVDALDALGAAYAEAARFEEAQTAARRAISIAAASSTPDRAEPIRTRLALYASREPFRSD
jgi:tetratricopeptide (TPR) repeat protein